MTTETDCRYCGRAISYENGRGWIDPEATGDDSIWAETCDRNDTFTAEHEPTESLQRLVVSYRGRDLKPSTVNRKMHDADPGFWDLDSTLVWGCPVSAENVRSGVEFTFGPGYTARLEPFARVDLDTYECRSTI